jgi:peptide/nickel transport system ATP-binding protein
MDDRSAIIDVQDFRKYFPRQQGFTRRVIGTVRAVDGVTFSIAEGETFALVGESGSGKTTTGRCILRAIEPTDGSIFFRQRDADEMTDVAALDDRQLNQVRRDMAMIFQDPYSSLCPRMRVVEIVGEAFINRHLIESRRDLEERVAELMEMVNLQPEYMRRFPHAFSGGQRQRIAIARALALRPRFIVADEPVSALDVSVQAQILNLMKQLQSQLNLTYLFIAHNLAVVEYISNRVAVMYVGKIVEQSATRNIFYDPKHPYTEALLSAVPKTDKTKRGHRIVLEGDIADPANPPPGCSFHPRCRYAQDVCKQEEPPLRNASSEERPHYAACHFADTLSLRGVEEL